MNFPLRCITTPHFRFNLSSDDAVSSDKFRGLQKYGPYQLPTVQRPLIGFVFPKQLRDLANRLYLAIRNGVGPYRGFATMFRLPLEKEQVFQVSDFEISDSHSHADRARRYHDAVSNWLSTGQARPDIFIVLLPRSPSWEDDSPYYHCKSLLLTHQILSQVVTTELIEHPTQFDWSVANIALATFVKLGGIPWIVDRRTAHREVVLGVGRTSLLDPQTRTSKRYVAFTVGLRGSGPFEFTAIAKPATTEQEYLTGLKEVIEGALARIKDHTDSVDSITLHVSKEFGWKEAAVIDAAVETNQSSAVINVLKVTDENDFFAIDTSKKEGVPSRGTCIQLSEDDYLLYTEGSEEKLAWRNRLPTGLRVKTYGERQRIGVFQELLSQVYDLSQVNYRGFNALSRPASLAYSVQVAKLLAHVHVDDLGKQWLDSSNNLQPRMWFL